MKKLLLMAVLGISFSLASASDPLVRKCASNDLLQQQLAADPGRAAALQQIENQTAAYIQAQKKNGANSNQAVITIPVVFHVVYKTTAQNISDAQCIAQLNQLNLDYARLNSDAGNTPAAFASAAANTQVQFCLAQRDPSGNATTGIIHKLTSVTSFSTNDNVKRSANGGDNAWDATKYLNIWTCNLGSGLLGYAQFPGGSASTDGVVVLYSSVGSMLSPGTAVPYHYGRTATHEVGHWLNLYHIWGDDGSSCSGTDNVSDTPNQSSENYGCPAFPHTDACSSGNGVMFMNYMDYTDDGCMNMFTNGQTSRMQALFVSGGARYSIVSSLGCTPPTGGSCNTATGLSTSGITTSGATLNWGAVTGAVSYNVQYRVVGAGSWTSTTSTTNSKSISGLSASTNYEWQVQTVCSGGSSSFTGSSTFTTLSSGGSCSDIYEPNNSRTAAKTVSTNVNITGLISPSGDNDYYKFTTTSPNTYIKIDLTNLPADYDLKLYNSSGTTLATSQNGGTTAEQIKRNTASAATYYVRVYGYNGANSSTSCYNLLISTKNSSWREIAEASDEPVTAMNEMVVYPNPSNGSVNIGFTTAVEGNVTIKIVDVLGKVITSQNASTINGYNKFSFDLSQTSKGIYFVQLTTASEQLTQRLILDK